VRAIKNQEDLRDAINEKQRQEYRQYLSPGDARRKSLGPRRQGTTPMKRSASKKSKVHVTEEECINITETLE